MINRENYEIWFIDYMDGKLNQEAIENLNAFLLLNPDLQEEFQLITSLPPSFAASSEAVFEHKLSLKKTESIISDEDSLLLAKEIEGVIEDPELDLLRERLSDNPTLQKHRDAMAKTRIQAPVFPFQYKDVLLFDEHYSGREDDLLILSVLEGHAQNSEQAVCFERMNHDSGFKERFDLFQKIKLSAPELWCDFRESLYFPAHPDFAVKEILLAAWVEGDLSGEEKHRAEEIIQRDSAWASWVKILQRLKLAAPQNIVFNHKSSLYRKEAVVVPLKKYFAYASGVAAAIVLVFWVLSRNNENPDQFATENNSKPKVNQSESAAKPRNIENNTATNSPSSLHDLNEIDHSPQPKYIDTKRDAVEQTEKPSDLPQNIEIIQENISIQNNEVAQNNDNSFDQNKQVGKDSEVNPNPVFIVNNTPDMGLVYQETNSNKKTVEQSGESLLSMVGRVAGERLGKTHAYTLAERQISKWTATTDENIEKKFTDDHLHFKLGNVSIDRKKELKPVKKERGGIIGLIQRTYRRVENKKK